MVTVGSRSAGRATGTALIENRATICGSGCRAIHASRLFTSAVRSARKSSVKSVAMTARSTAASMNRADV
jgi:hypothetical protein